MRTPTIANPADSAPATTSIHSRQLVAAVDCDCLYADHHSNAAATAKVKASRLIQPFIQTFYAADGHIGIPRHPDCLVLLPRRLLCEKFIYWRRWHWWGHGRCYRPLGAQLPRRPMVAHPVESVARWCIGPLRWSIHRPNTSPRLPRIRWIAIIVTTMNSTEPGTTDMGTPIRH